MSLVSWFWILLLPAPLLVYCDGGYRSRRAHRTIHETGFRRIFHLHRGIHFWNQSG